MAADAAVHALHAGKRHAPCVQDGASGGASARIRRIERGIQRHLHGVFHRARHFRRYGQVDQLGAGKIKLRGISARALGFFFIAALLHPAGFSGQFPSYAADERCVSGFRRFFFRRKHLFQKRQQLVAPRAVFGRPADDLPRLHKQGAADRCELLLSCAAADLVRLGGNHGERDVHLAEEEVHLLIVLGRLVADIHEAQDVAQFIGLLEVILHHLAPAEFLLLINLGEAVAGQVNQMKVVVEQEGVDEPGFSGRLGRARKGAAVAELIDEAAFADVGFPATAICGSPTPSNCPYCAIEVINSAFLISNFVSPFGV